MLSGIHVVLSGTFSGFYTDADRRDFTIDFISSDIHCIHTHMQQGNYVIVTSAACVVHSHKARDPLFSYSCVLKRCTC